MGTGEALDAAPSWTQIIKQGGAHRRSWERGIWEKELEDAAASPGLLWNTLGFQAGHGIGVTKDPWTCSPRILVPPLFSNRD